MNLEEQFFQFLKSDRMSEEFKYGTDSKILINRFSYNNKLDILFSIQRYRGNFFDLKTPFKYSGIYDKENNKLYDLEYSIRENILNWNWTDVRRIDQYDLYSQISKDVNDRVYQIVQDDKDEMFDIDGVEFDESFIDIDVTKEFIEGIKSSTYKDEIKKYETQKPQHILDYLTNKEIFLEIESRNYIVENMDTILKNLINSNERRKQLKQIEEDKNHPLHKIKAIIDSIKDNKFLTVNVTINKDGLEDTFKYEAQALRNQYNSIYLPTYNITNLKDREKFYKLYGDSDFYYNEIVKITYGKKDLYVDEKLLNLENKKDEMEASL